MHIIIDGAGAHPSPQFQSVLIIPKRNSVPFSVHLPTSPHPTPTTNLFFISVDLLILDISYKWNHSVCGPWPLFL